MNQKVSTVQFVNKLKRILKPYQHCPLEIYFNLALVYSGLRPGYLYECTNKAPLHRIKAFHFTSCPQGTLVTLRKLPAKYKLWKVLGFLGPLPNHYTNVHYSVNYWLNDCPIVGFSVRYHDMNKKLLQKRAKEWNLLAQAICADWEIGLVIEKHRPYNELLANVNDLNYVKRYRQEYIDFIRGSGHNSLKDLLQDHNINVRVSQKICKILKID